MGTITSSITEDPSRQSLMKNAYLVLTYYPSVKEHEVGIYSETTPTPNTCYPARDAHYICLEQASAETYEEARHLVIRNFNKQMLPLHRETSLLTWLYHNSL